MTMKCEETTKKYLRLPPPQAVPFTGFNFAKIKSREPVAEQLREFMRRTKESDFFTTGLVFAEWGEGKTDVYERYIKPEADCRGDHAYLVSTSTIVNKLSRADNLFPYGPPESVTLAACTLFALRDELGLRDDDISSLPNYQEIKEPSKYIEEVLSRIIGEGNEVIYLFIDEFEEILAQSSQIQKKFLSGLKELLNGQLKIIHEGGKYAGRLHFILACTPYAYNRIRGDIDLAQIFGALDSRLGSNKITLSSIGREEAFKFLIDILKFCYLGNLPQPLPVKSAGILNGICTISQRNLRSLVQLLSDLLNAATLDEELCVIDYQRLMDAFRGRVISVYGASTQRVDEDLLVKIESALVKLRYGEEYTKLFKLLAGELKSFSIEEIQQRLGIRDASYRVNEINQELRKIGIPNTVTSLNPLRGDKTIVEVLESLNPVENKISLGSGRRIPIESFKEEMIQFELGFNGEIFSKMFLPADGKELQTAFDLYEEESEELLRRLSRYFSIITATRHFMLSKELTAQLFPSPLVLQLDFIEDRTKRMELWREAMKGFLDRDLELRDSLIEVINREDRFKIVSSSPLNLKYTLPSGRPVNIPLAIHSSTGRITMNDVTDLQKLIKRDRPGLVLIFHVGEIEVNARTELNTIPNVLTIHIRQIRAQQLIALSIARRKGIKPNKGILDRRLREILYEIEFSQEFNKWLEVCRKEGLLLEDLQRPSGKSEKSLVQAMTYYIETIDEQLDLQQAFTESKKLQDFTLYGKQRPSFAPLDIETTDTLNGYQKELSLNGFLQEDVQDKVKISITPIEKRILDILEEDKLSIDEMKRRFISFAQNERLIEQVYLPLLEAKGLIQILKKQIYLINRQEIERNVQRGIKDYNEMIKSKNQEWWTYAHICISKERRDLIIILSEFDDYLKNLFEKLDSHRIKYNDKLCLRTLKLINNLLDYFNETLEIYINTALKRGLEIIEGINERYKEITGSLNGVLQFYNGFSEMNYSNNDVEDLINLRPSFQNSMHRYKANYNRNEIEEGLDQIASFFEPYRKFEGVPRYFYFNRSNEKASFFNYKIYKMEAASRGFITKFKQVNDKIKHIGEERRKFLSIRDQSTAKLVKYSIDKNYIISSTFHQTLLDYQIRPVKPQPFKTVSLAAIYTFIKTINRMLTEFNFTITESKRILDSLINNEKNLQLALGELENLAKRTEIFFDGEDELYKEASAIFSAIRGVMEMYNKRALTFQQTMKSTLTIDIINKKARETNKSIEKLIDSLDSEDRRIKNLHKKSIDILEEYESNVLKFLDLLEEGGIKMAIFSTPFKEVIGKSINYIEELYQTKDVKYTWIQIQKDLDDLRLQLYKEVKNVLSKDQFNLLFALVNASVQQTWFDLSILTEEFMSQFNKTEVEINEIIQSLIQMNLIKIGISLPI